MRFSRAAPDCVPAYRVNKHNNSPTLHPYCSAILAKVKCTTDSAKPSQGRTAFPTGQTLRTQKTQRTSGERLTGFCTRMQNGEQICPPFLYIVFGMSVISVSPRVNAFFLQYRSHPFNDFIGTFGQCALVCVTRDIKLAINCDRASA